MSLCSASRRHLRPKIANFPGTRSLCSLRAFRAGAWQHPRLRPPSLFLSYFILSYLILSYLIFMLFLPCPSRLDSSCLVLSCLVLSQAAIWQRLLTCPLFPLRRCLDTVRREFARLCCGLMEDYLEPDLVEHLAGISEEVRSHAMPCFKMSFVPHHVVSCHVVM